MTYASTISVRICFVRPRAQELYTQACADGVPVRATPYAAGYDVRACLECESVLVAPGARICVPTGIAIAPMAQKKPIQECFATHQDAQGVAAFLYSRSGLGAKHGLTVAQGTGVIDSDYRGEICVYLLNTATQAYRLHQGERIAQLVFQPVLQVEWEVCADLEGSDRGHGGFGHTGRH